MKLTSSILVLSLATAAAFAQAQKPVAPATKPAATAVKAGGQPQPVPAAKAPAATTQAKPSAAAKPPVKPAVTTAAKPATPEAKPAKATPAPATAQAAQKAPTNAAPAKQTGAAVKKVARAPKPAKAKGGVASANATKAPAPPGKRDPFISPIVSRIGGPTGCSSGKKCLVVDQVRLQGVVRAQKGMIAMVVNAANKTYFLYENDPVFNGYVSKITGDSIVFKETTMDRLGKPQTREVVKKVNTPSV